MSAAQSIYCIDSSSLIYCEKHYPIDIFQRLWSGLDQLAGDGRLIAHEEVWIEINKGTGFMTTWAAQWQTELSIVADNDQINMIQRIAVDYPLANYTTTTEHRADPWVVALAHTRTCSVVSQERNTSQPFPRIPQMCLKYGVSHMGIWDVIRAEGWVF